MFRGKSRHFLATPSRPSLLRHLEQLARDERELLQGSDNHRHSVFECLSYLPRAFVDPLDDGTFLPLTYVRAWDRNATVVIFPSDHFVFPEDRFLETVQRAMSACHILQDRILLLGVRPTQLELDYQWINVGGILGWSGGSCVRQVDSFIDKSGHGDVFNAMAKGALWHTSVIVGKVETIWKLGWRYLPVIMERFERLGRTIGNTHEGSALRQLYRTMPTLNFFTELLQRVPEFLGIIELEDVLWSDWERPDRILKTLNVLGKEPAFPQDIVMSTQSSSPSLSLR